jgi:hypothetical protein
MTPLSVSSIDVCLLAAGTSTTAAAWIVGLASYIHATATFCWPT